MDTGVGDIGIGLSLFSIDSLHTCYLGPWQRWCMYVFWSLIVRNVWDCGGNAESRHQSCIIRLRSDLMTHYKHLDKDTAERTTRLEDLTVKMLGTRSKPKLKTKAAETKHLVPFCLDMLGTHMGKLGLKGQALLRAGQCLKRFDAILEEQPRVLPRPVCEDGVHIGWYTWFLESHRSVSVSRDRVD
jgi:hypothetical protein